MEGMFFSIALITSDFIQFLLQGLFILSIYKCKWDYKHLALFTLINVLANDLPRFFIPQYLPALNLLIYLLSLFLTFKYVLKLTTLRSLLGSFILMLINTATEYIVMALLKISFQDKFVVLEWVNSPLHILLMRNTANFLCLFNLLVVRYFKMSLLVNEDVHNKKVLGIIINTLITLIFIVPNTLFFQNSIAKVPIEVIVFNAVSVLVLVALSLYNTIKSQELEAKKQEVAFQKLYNSTLSDLNDTLRGFKHDFNNIVQVMSGYLELENYEGLKQFFSQLQTEARTVNNIAPLNSYVKDNPAIYGLLLAKLSYAEILDIRFEIDVSAQISIGTVKIYDFCKVLGILIDNALEAASESSKKYAQLTINQVTSKNILEIHIRNTYGNPVEIHNIFTNGFTTKQNHSGFGLWEVQKIMSKYKNFYLFTNMKEDLFIQRIEISL